MLDLLADVVFAAEQVGELLEDRLFEFVGGDAFGVAVRTAVALAAEADVVAVAAAVAVGGGTDVALPAAGALDKTGEQVVGGVRAAGERSSPRSSRIACARSNSARSMSGSCGAAWLVPRKKISPR